MMNKKGGAASKNDTRDYTSKQAILCVSMFAMAIVILFLMVFFGGIKAGMENGGKEGIFHNVDKELISVDSKVTTVGYMVPDGNLPEAGDSYILNRFDGGNGNYRVIKSKSRLQDLLSTVLGYDTEDEVFDELNGLSNSFFTSGSVIAVAVEREALGADISTSNVFRDENYNIRVDINDKKNCFGVCNNGVLMLIKVTNIQPKEVDVQLRSNWTEAEYADELRANEATKETEEVEE